MTIQLVTRSPAAFVRHLVAPGLPTSRGAVPLNAYVSGRRRSPQAAAALALFNRLLARPRSRHGLPDAEAAAVAALGRAHAAVVGGGRASSWRRVFTGQGHPDHLALVWEFILRHRDFLVAQRAEHVHPGTRNPFEHYFGSPGNPVAAMVRDGIFGYDCLGFVGNYLCWAGARTAYPECAAEQYITRLGFEPLAGVAAVQPLTVLLWVDTGTQHIALVDRIFDRGADGVQVQICQSSAGGPQINESVEIRRNGATTVAAAGQRLQSFRFARRGTPAAPVAGHFVLARRPELQLAA